MAIDLSQLRESLLQLRAESNLRFGTTQAWSWQLDYQTGVDTLRIEADLRAQNPRYESEIWCEVPIETFQTPYHELVDLVDRYPADHWVELGAGYARLGLVVGALAPAWRYTGFEIVPDRVDAAVRRFQRYDMQNCRIRTGDLLGQDPAWIREGLREENEGWTNYFIYDFSHRQDLENLLENFRALLRGRRHFRVIARGQALRQLILNKAPWMLSSERVVHGERTSVFEILIE